MSIAAGDGAQLWRHDASGGARASATLIPGIQSLLAQAGWRLQELDAIVFGRGPGSFTGLRTACSVAQGLAFGARVPVLAVDTLMAVAEQARMDTGCEQVLTVLDARMDEVYSAPYTFAGDHWEPLGPARLCKPGALQCDPSWVLAGNVFAVYGERLPPAAARVDALPTAAALLRLAPQLLAAGQARDAAQALPLYIRDKVAQTTEERAALRSASTKP